jgi:hypothetical protein
MTSTVVIKDGKEVSYWIRKSDKARMEVERSVRSTNDDVLVKNLESGSVFWSTLRFIHDKYSRVED